MKIITLIIMLVVGIWHMEQHGRKTKHHPQVTMT